MDKRRHRRWPQPILNDIETFRITMRLPVPVQKKCLSQFWSKKLRLGCWAAASAIERCHARTVSTLSPLAAAFNAKPKRNLLKVFQENKGLFGVQELKEPYGFFLLTEKAENEIEEKIKEATSPDRTRKLVEIFDEISDCICRVADLSDFVRSGHPDKVYRHCAHEAFMQMSGLVEELNTNTVIYDAIKSVVEHGDKVATDKVDERVADLFKFDFEQCGIHLDEEKRKTFVELNESVLLLGNNFMNGTQTAVSVRKDQLPEKIRHCFNIEGDNICIWGLYSDHYNELVREAAYRVYLHHNKERSQTLDQLLQSRHILAQVVDFSTFAERALKGTLAETPEKVKEFLTLLADKLRDKAQKDYEKISELKKKDSGKSKVMPWDIPYYTSVGRSKMVKVEHQDLMPYFSLGNCMDGLNNLFQKLYGVTLKNVDPQPGELWYSDVHKLAVTHDTEGVLGYIYCDFYERAEKPSHDCHFTIQGGRMKRDGTYQHPKVVLQLNFSPPQRSVPSLLHMGAVENLFHEFGHAMHSMLGRTKYQHVTGTRCPTDFAEVPSVLMEYFVSDPRVLSTFARHYSTGEPLPDSVIKNLSESKRLFVASELQLQVFYAMLDQIYHGKETPGKSTMDILKEVQNKYYGIPYVEGTAYQLRFSHLVGYGARYYSYLLSRAVASRIWRQCFKKDPFNRKMGEKYRQEVLSHGGSKHPKELVEGLLNEEYSLKKLVDSLVDDVQQSATA